MSNTFVVTGGIVAEPERREVGNNHLIEFPLYDNETRKNKETGEYEKTGKVLKLKVTVWNDKADAFIDLEAGKGDLVKVTCTITEDEFVRKDGTPGRQLKTTFVDSVEIVHKSTKTSAAPAEQDIPF